MCDYNYVAYLMAHVAAVSDVVITRTRSWVLKRTHMPDVMLLNVETCIEGRKGGAEEECCYTILG